MKTTINSYDDSALDLFDEVSQEDSAEVKPNKNKKKKSETKVGRCALCKTYLKIDKRMKAYYDTLETAMCDICLINQDTPDYDYKDELEVELELELLKNPSGRLLPKLYEE